MQNTIAIICDCDETLAPDTTNFLLEENGINSKKFWKEIEKLIKDGWDPPLAWMTRIVELMDEGTIKENTYDKLVKLGKKVKPYDGVPLFISQLQSKLKKKQYTNFNIKLEAYIISSGIEDIIRGTKFSQEFKDVFGSKFSIDKPTKKINGVKSIVSFTEKTKFLYAINKGITDKQLRSNPFLVNDRVKKDSRRIPFNNMIYLGDSTGDVPCFAAVTYFKGSGIGILTKKDVTKGFKLAKERRSTVGPYKPNYKNGSTLRIMLDDMVEKIANRIIAENS
jgi:hypothetical protein